MDTNPVVAPATSEIRKIETFGEIKVSRVYPSNYQKEGTLTAELKQTVETESFYPTKSVSSNLQDNPFSTEEFGFEEKEYKTPSTRVTWIDVPMNATVAAVTAKLATLPTARLYRILSNHPIVSDRQQYAIDNPIPGATVRLTLDVIADRQAVRYPTNHETLAGKLIVDQNGKPQFKGVFYKSTHKEDIDRRTVAPSDFYASPLMKEEMTGVGEQSLTTL